MKRNALDAAYEAAKRVADEINNDLICDVADLLDIYSRRSSLNEIPFSTMHEMFQDAAPLLDEAEHLFNAALAGERLLRPAQAVSP